MRPARSYSISGPYFEDLSIGETLAAPALTLTDGHVALHQAIVGDRVPACLDSRLSEAVFGLRPAPAGLVIDTAIGQSSVFTRRVRANLFYRGLRLHRLPAVGDTLHTTTQVVALKQNQTRPDRVSTGLAVLRITTVDQDRQVVLDFERCAMIPLRDRTLQSGHRDDVSSARTAFSLSEIGELPATWRLHLLRGRVPGPYGSDLAAGDSFAIEEADPVTGATELARLTVNLAEVHYDHRASGEGRRLVYGGHTIGLAAHQVAKALPALSPIIAWEACEHTGPVYEGDLLTSEITVEGLSPLAEDCSMVSLRSVVSAHRDDGPVRVLDWRYAAAIA